MSAIIFTVPGLEPLMAHVLKCETHQLYINIPVYSVYSGCVLLHLGDLDCH